MLSKRISIPNVISHISASSHLYALFGIIFLAVLLRLNGITSGFPFFYYFDEHYAYWDPFIIIQSGNFVTNPPGGHPGWFLIYFFVSIYSLIIVIFLVYHFLRFGITDIRQSLALLKTNPFIYYGENPVFFVFVARLCQVAFAAVSIYVLYLIGKKLFNKSVGLLGAFCLSISPLHIKFSRIARTDISAAMLILLAFYFLICFDKKKNKTYFLVLSALCAGFAIADRYITGIIVTPLLLYGILGDHEHFKGDFKGYLKKFFIIQTKTSQVFFFTLLGFLLFGFPEVIQFSRSLRQIKVELNAKNMGQLSQGYISNIIWYIRTAFREGIGGIFFQLFSLFGLVCSLRERSKLRLLFLVFPVLFFLIISMAGLRWQRWAIPILSFQALLFGLGFHRSYLWLRKKLCFPFAAETWAILFSVVLLAASLPVIQNDIYSGTKLNRPDTRTLAKEWIEQNLPIASRIAYEQYTPQLHINSRKDLLLVYTQFSPIVARPMSYFRKFSVNYFIISDNFRNQFYASPQEHPLEISRYEELKNIATLIKTFPNDNLNGPVIEIYKLNN